MIAVGFAVWRRKQNMQPHHSPKGRVGKFAAAPLEDAEHGKDAGLVSSLSESWSEKNRGLEGVRWLNITPCS